MSDVVIRVEGLSKKYRYGESGFNSGTLRDALTDAARSAVCGPLSVVRSLQSAATWPFRRFGDQRSAISQSKIANPKSKIGHPFSAPWRLRAFAFRPSQSATRNRKSKIR